MRRRNRYNRIKNRERRERLMMLFSAVFVLTALTMTGVYVKGNNEKNKDDGYTIDFTKMEGNEDESEIITQTVPPATDYAEQMAKADLESADPLHTEKMDSHADDFMDYLPSQEDADVSDEVLEEEPEYAQAAEFIAIDEKQDKIEEEESVATAGEAVATIPQPEPSFGENDHLKWPIVGNVLINYSMDKSVYFATLQQYKYSPAIVIAATEGQTIGAAADGRVSAIYENEEIGNAVVVELGNGYQLTYGQLKNLQVQEGSYVETGDILGEVAAPTKYYSVEGCNVYFKLTKDGNPVNPMGRLE